MKTIACALAVAIALVAASLIYPATMRVTEVDHVVNTVSMETSTGQLFAMSGTEDWEVDDVASVLMFSCGTEQVKDDIILAARYSGFTYGQNVR